MQQTPEILRSIIDSLALHVIVIDRSGYVQYANRAWIQFADCSGCLVNGHWEGIDYPAMCEKNSRSTDIGTRAAAGIRKALKGETSGLAIEYPCNTSEGMQWFAIRVVPLKLPEEPLFLVTHENITEKKRDQNELRRLSRIDALTGLANRRSFDETLLTEWRRSAQNKTYLSLLFANIDDFGLYNRRYGYPEGNVCLQRISGLLHLFERRPGDTAARYSAENLALILCDCTASESGTIAENLRQAVEKLAVPNDVSGVAPVVTVSIGAATIFPAAGGDMSLLPFGADRFLYVAKERGRNRVANEFNEYTHLKNYILN